MNIQFEYMTDANDCETCGGGYAEGGRVHIDGHCVVDMTPVATCYDGTSYGEYEIFQALFEHLGLNALFEELNEKARLAEWSEDTNVYMDALTELGYVVSKTCTDLYEPIYDDDGGYIYGDEDE